MPEQIDINDICGDILNNGKYLGDHSARIKTLMEHFAKAGTPIATVASARYLDRALSTIKHYCCEYGIALADWTPMSMLPQKPPKAKKSK